MRRVFDPFDAAHSRDAWSELERLRADTPVADIASGMRYVTRHADARDVLRNTTAFSNAAGMKAPGVEIPAEDRLLGELDPPRHTAVRRVIVTAMTPKVVHAAEAFMTRTARELLDALPRDDFDLVRDYTAILPNRVTMYLLGFDPADADQLARWAKELMESTFPALNRTERGVGFAAAFPEFAGYIDARIAERAAELARRWRGRRRARPAADARRRRRAAPAAQLRALVRNLITGGLTTTSQLLGNLLFQLLADPELERALRADETLVTNAIEESLRLTPPLLFLARGVQGTDRDQWMSGPQRRARHRRRRVRESRRARLRRRQRLPRRPRQRRPTPHVRLRPARVPGRDARAHRCSRVGIDAFFESFAPGSVTLDPDFVFEQVPTYFEYGPRRLPARAAS